MRIVFLGTGEIGLPTLRLLIDSPEYELIGVVTQPDKPAGRQQTLRPSAIKTAALAAGLPVFQPIKVRAPEALSVLAEWRPEVIAVMAYGQILPRALLNLPSRACLNLHASVLPRHRGAAPIQAAIMAGDSCSGITVMYMAEGLDTGDVLLTRELPIRRRETGGSLHDRLGLLAPGALAEALTLLRVGNAPRTPQNEALATYAGKLSRESGVIDWAQPARVIERQIRAFNPWPASFTTLPGGKKLKVFSAIVHRQSIGDAGTVLRADGRGLLVAAGEGAVLLREIQLEAKMRMSAGQFLRGNAVTPGERLL